MVFCLQMLTYFRTPLVQTGRLPPVKGVADKATWQHNTRMLSGLVTVVPDSQTLLQAFLTGTEVCPGGSGDLMCASLVKTWQPYIKGSQYNGLAADGATLHCNVGSKLADHFKRKGHDDYDPLHKAGLVDVHMRAPGAGENFKFLQEINDVISNGKNGKTSASILPLQLQLRLHTCQYCNICQFKTSFAPMKDLRMK